MKYLLLALLVISLLFGPRIAVNSFVREQPVKKAMSTDTLWSLVQDWRTDNGFQPYTKDQNLCGIAEKRVEEQTVITDDHEGFTERFKNGKYPSTISENLSKGAVYAKDALDGWLNSPSHRKALETNYKYSCIATRGSAAVQIFSNCENGCP